MEKKIFELIPHTADIQLRIYGESFEDLLRNALKSMFVAIGPVSKEYGLIALETIPETLDRTHDIDLSAPSKELLLVDFLSEALYLSDVHNEAYFDAKFSTCSETDLAATILGIAIERFEVVEIKAVTYHDLLVEKMNGFWQAQVVFDI